MNSLIAIVALSVLELTVSAKFPVISTTYGTLRGYSYTADDGTEALIFKKIPFASPPIDVLRWRKPEPPKKWNGTLDSTFFGPGCAQRSSDDPVTGYSEDCLHINVYTSEKCMQGSPCPVVFVIHGGAGTLGHVMTFPDEIMTRNFVSQDIIVVTTAYRLEVFGAMALGDENALPANLALHDIIAALKFTRSEIGHFGGDKERITLLGHSSGAQYALMIAFSPGISKQGETRLFHSIISMSGTTGLESQEATVRRSHNVASALGCEGTAREIIECLRPINTQTLIDAAFNVHGTNVMTPESPFGVTMAGELFPIRNSLELREDKEPVRIMMGSTIFELGTKFGSNVANRVVGIVNDEECYEKYTKDVASGAFVPGYNEQSQDVLLTNYLFAKDQAELGAEVYLYEYGYPKHGFHTDDAYLVLGFHEFELDENEKWLSRVYPRYFTNFIKGDSPANDWTRVTTELMNYYSINKSISEGVAPHMEYGYQRTVVLYYDNLVKYDNMLSAVKETMMNAPVEYKCLNFTGNSRDFFNSLIFVDVLIIVCIVIGAILLIRCLSKCCTRACRKRRGCEHEPLLE